MRDLWVVYLVVLCSAAYIAYEQNLAYLTYGFSSLQKNGYGGLDNNGAALIMAMAIPMAYFAWEATRRWWRWGFLMMIPLRRAFIVKQHGSLTFPEGTACAKVLIVGEQGGSSAKTVFVGFGLAFAYQVIPTDAPPERQFAKRWTYYIDPTGKIAFIDKTVKPATSGQDIVAKLGDLNVPKRK